MAYSSTIENHLPQIVNSLHNTWCCNSCQFVSVKRVRESSNPLFATASWSICVYGKAQGQAHYWMDRPVEVFWCMRLSRKSLGTSRKKEQISAENWETFPKNWRQLPTAEEKLLGIWLRGFRVSALEIFSRSFTSVRLILDF